MEEQVQDIVEITIPRERDLEDELRTADRAT